MIWLIQSSLVTLVPDKAIRNLLCPCCLCNFSTLWWHSVSTLTVSVCPPLSANWIAVSPLQRCTAMISICCSAVRQSSIIFTDFAWPWYAAACRGVCSYTISNLSLYAEDCRDVSSLLIISVWSLIAAKYSGLKPKYLCCSNCNFCSSDSWVSTSLSLSISGYTGEDWSQYSVIISCRNCSVDCEDIYVDMMTIICNRREVFVRIIDYAHCRATILLIIISYNFHTLKPLVNYFNKSFHSYYLTPGALIPENLTS